MQPKVREASHGLLYISEIIPKLLIHNFTLLFPYAKNVQIPHLDKCLLTLYVKKGLKQTGTAAACATRPTGGDLPECGPAPPLPQLLRYLCWKHSYHKIFTCRRVTTTPTSSHSDGSTQGGKKIKDAKSSI